jgi:uncharacterized protein with PQ loop repeat
MNIDIFGYFAAILTTAAFLPQLIKTIKTKKADDVFDNINNVYYRCFVLDYLRL